MSFFLEQKYGFSLCLELRNFRRDSKRFEENRQQNDGSRSKRIASYGISFNVLLMMPSTYSFCT